jgi:hypothetical protein
MTVRSWSTSAGNLGAPSYSTPILAFVVLLDGSAAGKLAEFGQITVKA